MASPFLSCSMAVGENKKKGNENMTIYKNDFYSPASSLSVIFLTVPGVMRGAWTAWINAGSGLPSPGVLTLFGGQRVLFFGLRLLQLCLVKISDFSHVGLVRHFACEG